MAARAPRIVVLALALSVSTVSSAAVEDKPKDPRYERCDRIVETLRQREKQFEALDVRCRQECAYAFGTYDTAVDRMFRRAIRATSVEDEVEETQDYLEDAKKQLADAKEDLTVLANVEEALAKSIEKTTAKLSTLKVKQSEAWQALEDAERQVAGPERAYLDCLARCGQKPGPNDPGEEPTEEVMGAPE